MQTLRKMLATGWRLHATVRFARAASASGRGTAATSLGWALPVVIAMVVADRALHGPLAADLGALFAVQAGYIAPFMDWLTAALADFGTAHAVGPQGADRS